MGGGGFLSGVRGSPRAQPLLALTYPAHTHPTVPPGGAKVGLSPSRDTGTDTFSMEAILGSVIEKHLTTPPTGGTTTDTTSPVFTVPSGGSTKPSSASSTRILPAIGTTQSNTTTTATAVTMGTSLPVAMDTTGDDLPVLANQELMPELTVESSEDVGEVAVRPQESPPTLKEDSHPAGSPPRLQVESNSPVPAHTEAGEGSNAPAPSSTTPTPTTPAQPGSPHSTQTTPAVCSTVSQEPVPSQPDSTVPRVSVTSPDLIDAHRSQLSVPDISIEVFPALQETSALSMDTPALSQDSFAYSQPSQGASPSNQHLEVEQAMDDGESLVSASDSLSQIDIPDIETPDVESAPGMLVSSLASSSQLSVTGAASRPMVPFITDPDTYNVSYSPLSLGDLPTPDVEILPVAPPSLPSTGVTLPHPLTATPALPAEAMEVEVSVTEPPQTTSHSSLVKQDTGPFSVSIAPDSQSGSDSEEVNVALIADGAGDDKEEEKKPVGTQQGLQNPATTQNPASVENPITENLPADADRPANTGHPMVLQSAYSSSDSSSSDSVNIIVDTDGPVDKGQSADKDVPADKDRPVVVETDDSSSASSSSGSADFTVYVLDEKTGKLVEKTINKETFGEKMDVNAEIPKPSPTSSGKASPKPGTSGDKVEQTDDDIVMFDVSVTKSPQTQPVEGPAKDIHHTATDKALDKDTNTNTDRKKDETTDKDIDKKEEKKADDTGEVKMDVEAEADLKVISVTSKDPDTKVLEPTKTPKSPNSPNTDNVPKTKDTGKEPGGEKTEITTTAKKEDKVKSEDGEKTPTDSKGESDPLIDKDKEKKDTDKEEKGKVCEDKENEGQTKETIAKGKIEISH